jgi:hypothetical protein
MLKIYFEKALLVSTKGWDSCNHIKRRRRV